ncbi:ANTAR domain-containing response regulator [Sphingomonas sp.]|uniref:ANTAR domain-containing response regulator n=1 Tax=Sphingomonas sp. TaxID=28214 RepID=UPI003CC669B1
MTAPRLVQNFRGVRAVIVADPCAQLDSLVTTLGRLGLDVQRLPPADADGRFAALHEDRDVLFVDGDLADPVTVPMSATGCLPRAPVIGLVGIEAPGRLRTIMGLGATALLRKPVHTAAVYSALYLCVNEHRRRRELERRIERQEMRLQGRRHVIRAAVQLAVRHGLDDDRAYAVLRRESMRARQSLEAYCASLAAGGCPAPSPVNTEPQEAHHAALRL